jgi:hypothetical protein
MGSTSSTSASHSPAKRQRYIYLHSEVVEHQRVNTIKIEENREKLLLYIQSPNLGPNSDKSYMYLFPSVTNSYMYLLRVFLLAIHSHLQIFALDLYFFTLTQPLTVSTVELLYTVKEKGGKPDREPYHLPYGLRNPYRNLKSENSQDYARQPQRNCTSMNWLLDWQTYEYVFVESDVHWV